MKGRRFESGRGLVACGRFLANEGFRVIRRGSPMHIRGHLRPLLTAKRGMNAEQLGAGPQVIG